MRYYAGISGVFFLASGITYMVDKSVDDNNASIQGLLNISLAMILGMYSYVAHSNIVNTKARIAKEEKRKNEESRRSPKRTPRRSSKRK